MPDENGQPLIEEVSLQDALRDGARMGKRPEEIAGAVRKWHELTLAYGANTVPQEESARYFKASRIADEKTQEALGGLRDAAVTAYVTGQIPEPERRKEFAKAYKAANGDPAKLNDDSFTTAAAAVNQIVRDPVYGKVGGETGWQDIGSGGGVSLGKFKARPKGGDGAEVFVSARNEKQGWFGRRVEVKTPTPDDVDARMAELEAQREATVRAIADQEAFMDPDRERSFFERWGDAESAAAGGGLAQANLLKLQRAQLLETENAIVELKNGREALLMAERVTDAVKGSDFAGMMGDRGFGNFVEDMQRGLVKFYKNTELAARAIAGDDEGAEDVAEMIGRMEQLFPGSSGSRFRGGVGGFVSQFGETLGNMAPTIGVGLATGGQSVAAQVAGRAATLGSMAPNAFGGGAGDALNMAALREQQATAAALAGDAELAAKLNAEAKAARDNMMEHAAKTAAIEIGTELLLPADELFKVRKGADVGRRIGAAVGSNAVEETVAEGLNQSLALQTLNDDRSSVGDIARAAALGGLMGGGIQSLGVGRDALLARGDGSGGDGGSEELEAEVPDAPEVTGAPDGAPEAPAAIPEGLPSTPPTATDPMGTIPETQATIAEQIERVKRGTKPAMLVPGRSAAEMGQLPEGLKAIDTGAGVIVAPAAADPEQVRAAADGGQLGDVLGYGVAMRPENPDRAVVLRNRAGLEVDAVAADQSTEATVRAALTARAEEGDSVGVEGMDQLIQARSEQEAADLEPVTESPATMGEIAEVAGSTRISLTEDLEELGARGVPEAVAEPGATAAEPAVAAVPAVPREMKLVKEDDSPEAVRKRIERLEAAQLLDPHAKAEVRRRIAAERAKLPEPVPTAEDAQAELAGELERRRDLVRRAKRSNSSEARKLLKDLVFGVDGESKAAAIRHAEAGIEAMQRQLDKHGPMPGEEAEPVEPEKPRRRFFTADSTVLKAFKEDATISQLLEHGRLLSKSAATKRNRAKAKDNASLWDGARDLVATPAHNIVYDPDQGLWPDEMATLLGIGVDEMWELIREASHGALSLVKQQDAEEDRLEGEMAQRIRFEDDALEKEAGDATIYVSSLKVGDVVQLDDAPMKVKSINPHTGSVTLQDGETYGAVTVQDGQVIYGQVEKDPEVNGEQPQLSRSRAGQRGRVKATHVRNAANVIRKKLPGLFNGRVTIHANAAEFFADGSYARPDEFTPGEQGLISNPDTEGFYDGATGHVIVFTDNIAVRPGETEARAVARVILHETVGHGGLSHLMTADESFALQFDELAGSVEMEHGAELDAIAEEDGYGNLAADRNALVMEWFARQVEAQGPAQFGLTGLAAKMWDAFKATLARAFAGFNRSAATKVEIRSLVGRAAQAWRAGTAAPTTAGGLALSMGGRSIFHKDGEAFRVNNLASRAILTGSPLPRVIARVVAENETSRRALDESSAQIGRDLDAAIVAHARKHGRPLADVYDDVAKILDGAQPGGIAVFAATDPTLSERLRIARNHLDNMSGAILHTIPAGSMRDAMRANVGKWLRRSYAAFDPDSGWNYDRLTAAARDGKEINGRPAKEIIDAALVVLAKENPNASSDEMEAIMRDLMDRDNFMALAGGGSAVKKQVSSLLVREEIPLAIRDLMGEERNPVHRFSRSSQFQAQFLQRHQEQIALRNIGLQSGIFKDERGGVYTEKIPGGELGLAWSPLKGLWTTPQMWTALKQTNGTVTGTDVGSILWKGLRWMSNEAKLNRVALNPDSWMVNVLGNVAALIQTGDLFYTSFFTNADKAAHKRPEKGLRRLVPARLNEAIQLRQSGKAKDGELFDAAYEGVTDAQRALMARLADAGVVGNDLTHSELRDTTPRHLLQWLEDDTRRDRLAGAAKGAVYGQATVKGLGVVAQSAAGAAGAAVGAVAGYDTIHKINMRIAELAMTGPDQIGRIVGYLGNYETAMAAGMKPAEAFEWASERTRNTFPDYGKLPTVVRNLSRFGVLGSFIAFQWEVYRNSIWNLRYAKEEITSGNAVLVRRGLRRISGVAAMGYFATGGIAAAFGAVGADDERNKRWRKWFGAPWERHAMVAFSRYDDKGVSYFNTSYLLPQATILEIARAAFDGDDPMEAVGNMVAQALQQFAGSSVHVTPLLQAISGRDGRGNPISAAETAAGQIAERVAHASKTILEPGWTQKIDRLGYALRGADRGTRSFSVDEETWRLFGVRSYSRPWGQLVKGAYQGDRLAGEYDRIRMQANRALGANTPGAQRKAIERANEQIESLNEELEQFERDLILLQVPAAVRAAGRKDGGVPKRGFAPVEYVEATNRVGSVPEEML